LPIKEMEINDGKNLVPKSPFPIRGSFL